MIHTEIQAEPIIEEVKPDLLQAETEVSMLDILVLLLERKRFVLRFVAGAAMLSVVVALVLPVRYEGKVVLLPPQQNSSIGSALMGQLGGMGALGSLASLAGGGLNLKNPADMYVSFLTSRTVEDAMIQRFGLMKEYREKRMSDARKEFERRSSVVAGTKDGLIRITIEDGDQKRVAELANGWVDEFRKLSATLAITEAARRRLFFEQQVQQAKQKLTEAEEAMAKTQQATGVLQIDSQARALIESAAILRAQVVAERVGLKACGPSLPMTTQVLFLPSRSLRRCKRGSIKSPDQTATSVLISISPRGESRNRGWNTSANIATSNTRRRFTNCWPRNSKLPNSTRRARVLSFRS